MTPQTTNRAEELELAFGHLATADPVLAAFIAKRPDYAPDLATAG